MWNLKAKYKEFHNLKKQNKKMTAWNYNQLNSGGQECVRAGGEGEDKTQNGEKLRGLMAALSTLNWNC